MERQVPWVVPARLCNELQDQDDEAATDEAAVADEDEVEEKPREVSIIHQRVAE